MRKCRYVSSEPVCRCFTPDSPVEGASCGMVVVSVDELEAVRLCDCEHMEQGEAAARMGVSRGTFQRVLYAARAKIACALVDGMEIRIEGGSYRILRRRTDNGPPGKKCGCRYCARARRCCGSAPAPEIYDDRRME